MAVTMGQPRHRPDGVCVGSPPPAKKSKVVLANSQAAFAPVELRRDIDTVHAPAANVSNPNRTVWNHLDDPPSPLRPPDQHMHRLLHNLPSEKNISSCVGRSVVLTE